MRFRLIIGIMLLLFTAACQGPPPTMVVLVVTATLETGAEQTADVQTSSTAETLPPTPTPQPTAIPPTATSAPGNAPTPTIGQIQVAEQVFEKGRMFWIQPVQQIWVMFDDGSGEGSWSVYQDTFQDGDPESDPSLVLPPERYQPLRGFGKLWRGTAAVKDGLGLGLTPEFGYVSSYEYHPLQQNAQGQWVGYHILNSLYQEKFRFDEATGRWERLS
ncbi:MAG: hypothetical protein JNJ61_00600 [Anaerolineae bacterium]|nr:hypothetical protein [Anaerolineae bacterium]